MYVSSFDLGCADEVSKSETAAVHRLIVYIYIIYISSGFYPGTFFYSRFSHIDSVFLNFT